MRRFYQRVSELLDANSQSFAICTVVETKGSTPRHSGKMIVFENGSSEFTIGGGPAEKGSIDLAVKAISENRSQLVEWILNKDQPGGLSVECGGRMLIHIEVFPMRPQLVLVGAGHVNYALFKQAADLNFDVLIVDDRETVLTDVRFSGAKAVVYNEAIDKAVVQALPLLNPRSYVVIATKDADEAALRPFKGMILPYIGVIGSRRKIGKIREHLLADGYDADWLNQLFMPIGLGIGGETPEEIAISIWAEILMVLHGGQAVSKRGSDYEQI